MAELAAAPLRTAIGKRHSLKMTNILNKDATINSVGGVYESLDRYECRDKLWKDMEDAGLTLKVRAAMCCGVLRRTAAYCGVLRRAAACCGVLRCTALRCVARSAVWWPLSG